MDRAWNYINLDEERQRKVYGMASPVPSKPQSTQGSNRSQDRYRPLNETSGYRGNNSFNAQPSPPSTGLGTKPSFSIGGGTEGYVDRAGVPRQYVPLNTLREQILSRIKHNNEEIRYPPRLVKDGDRSKFCELHDGYGHETEECGRLRSEIDKLGQDRGNTRVNSVRSEPGGSRKAQSPSKKTQVTGVINTILGGTLESEYSRKCKKKKQKMVMSVSTGSPWPSIVFGPEDAKGVEFPHEDALIVSAIIGSKWVKRLLVDDGSSVNLLTLSVFLTMGGSKTDLKPVNIPLLGLGGAPVIPEGMVELDLELGIEIPQEDGTEGILAELTRKCKPVKQKKRTFSLEKQIAIRDEVEKLLKAGFIRKVDYPEWLANVVLIKKSNGRWRLCIDFTDLNNACPKDSFPLPNIDQLVDATCGFAVYAFLDASQGYHQIPMNKDDEEKTEFTTDLGTYCYKKMPFDQLGKNVEVYVDDIVVKSRGIEDHAGDLAETCEKMKGFNLKLNPEKCVFAIRSGKFLGHLISEKGIESNPEKIEAVMNMKAPNSVKEVQKLNGRVTALGRFMKECNAAFEELKVYLSTPPVLGRPEPGEILYLYLSVNDETAAAVLVKEDKVAAEKLRRYFEAHIIVVRTNQPLRKTLQRPEMSGRLVLADFIAETTASDQPEEADEQLLKWVLEVDGASNLEGSGAGVVLRGPHGVTLRSSVKFDFPASNNAAEYEALLIGLRMVNMVKAEHQVPRLENQEADVLAKAATVDEKDTWGPFLCSKAFQHRQPRNHLSDPAFGELDARHSPLPDGRNSAREQRQSIQNPATSPVLCFPRWSLVQKVIHPPVVEMPNNRGGRVCSERNTRRYLWGAHSSSHVGKESSFAGMVRQAEEIVKKCENCQRHQNIRHAPTTEQCPITSPWPFATWGIDILGPFTPTTGQKKFLIVAVDHFTKWIEVEAVSTITEARIRDFFWRQIVCRFGIPRALVTDNGKQFNCRAFREFCNDLHIDLRFTSVVHPQSNGMTEVTNRTILKRVYYVKCA
ncbi:uncharacterized protein LOC126681766 [Mercurialis annua]|uniref:uncharacterized protein LOC126681766 n=1 Tax=Mercurialis annua TaxID=3986 RepID=UPI00215EF89E|nr:uncharacterized protein LOC126681766 [Mercurialis annua]